jgi:glycosyltransferase involved in cell wall biosynthesis
VKLSVVVPCFNEEDVVPLLYDEVVRETDRVVEEWELVLVDDGSSDETLAQCRKLAESDARVVYVSLTRNFGKESALLAGLAAATGDAVILMDADLQHPPQLIPELVAMYKAGHDQVVTRRSRAGDPPLKRLVSRSYYGVVKRLMDVRIEDGTGDFRLLSRRAVTALLSMPETNRFSKGLFSWIGYEGPTVHYVDAARSAGESKWSLRQLLNYGVDGVIAFNVKPLRMLVWTGLVVLALSLTYIGVIVVGVIVRGIDAPGYVTLITAILGLGGLQLVGLGVLGEYVGRIYLEVKRRPHYLVRDTNLGAPPRTDR